MSRVHDFSCKQSSLESNDGLGPTIKYTSQPQLNGSPADYIGNNNRQYYNPGNDALTPLSLKTSITFPRQPGIGQTATSHGLQKPPKPPERKPLCSLTRQDNVRSSYDSSSNNYPDLARHPLSYSVAPPLPPPPSNTINNMNRYSRTLGHPVRHPGYNTHSHVQFPNQMTRSFGGHNRQNSSDDGHFDYEHSRSSSLGDLWGFNGVQDNRMATPDGFKSLPYDSNVKLAVNGVKKRTARSGAVKIDLTCADKSIRRPGSAPDLVGADEAPSCHNSPGANSLRDKKNGSFKDRARSTSSESRENVKKVGVSPGTRKVAFAGIEDDDSESESEKQSRDSITSVEVGLLDLTVSRPVIGQFANYHQSRAPIGRNGQGGTLKEDVWVKQPPLSAKRPPTDAETIQTTGVVIAKAAPSVHAHGPGSAPPPPPPHQQFQSSKLQQQQPQNKCNGVR